MPEQETMVNIEVEIPYWLNAIAEEQQLNLSSILETALIKKLTTPTK